MKKFLVVIILLLCLVFQVKANRNPNRNIKKYTVCKKEHRYKKTNFSKPYFVRKHKHRK